LTTEQRRAQLLRIGVDVFARRSYEQVSIEEVAELADVSHGLLYRYFPSKQAFFDAVVEVEGANLLRASSPDPTLSPLDQIKAGLDVYIDQAEKSPSGYRIAHRAGNADGDLGRTHQTRIMIQRDRILASLAAVIPIDSETPLAVTSWLGFVQTAILDWIDNPNISRQQLHNLCIRTLWAAIGLPA
jgi:AcrR family transcriptional regulator